MLNWVQPKTPLALLGAVSKNSWQMVGSPFPYPLYLDLRKRLAAMEDMVAFKDVSRLTANAAGEAESIDGEFVSGNFYHALGVRSTPDVPSVKRTTLRRVTSRGH